MTLAGGAPPWTPCRCSPAIEYEGDHHREQPQFRRDITLHAAGWTVIRLTDDDVLRRRAPTIRIVTTTMQTLLRQQPTTHNTQGHPAPNNPPTPGARPD